jgi:hypothetical protein
MEIKISRTPVYYMNMPEDFARGQELETKLLGAGFRDVVRVETELNYPKSRGVALAHKKALQEALKDFGGPFIILEDDVEFFRSPGTTIEWPEDAHALYLGVSRWGLRNGKGALHIAAERANNGFYRLYNMLAAHAILYPSFEYANFILNSIDLFINMPTNQDKMRAETMKYWNVYSPARPLFYQSGKYEKDTRFQLPGATNRPLSFFYI